MKDKNEVFAEKHPYIVEIVVIDPLGGRTVQYSLTYPEQFSAVDAAEAAFNAAAEFEPNRLEDGNVAQD